MDLSLSYFICETYEIDLLKLDPITYDKISKKQGNVIFFPRL